MAGFAIGVVEGEEADDKLLIGDGAESEGLVARGEGYVEDGGGSKGGVLGVGFVEGGSDVDGYVALDYGSIFSAV